MNKPENLEIVLTGRYAHPELKAMAHLVTEMKPIKHYFDTGVMARQGIEYQRGFSFTPYGGGDKSITDFKLM